MGDSKLCIYSYNSRGFSDTKKEYCKYLMNTAENNIPILCNQENFILQNSYSLRRAEQIPRRKENNWPHPTPGSRPRPQETQNTDFAAEWN